MEIGRYDILTVDDSTFYFFSSGKNGIIEKRIVYSATEVPDYFRLSFGDFVDNYIEENSISDNGDADIIIGTVAWSIVYFTRKDAKRRIKFTGATKSRTRLFAMWINKHSEELLKHLNIYGYYNGRCEKFIPNKQYESFLFSLKI